MRDNCWATLTKFAINLVVLSAFTILLASTSLAETIWLSSLDLKQMTSGWSEPKADLGGAGNPHSIGGKKFPHGVGTHAESTFRLKLDGHAKRFSARVGVDDSAGGHGSVEFIIIGDRRVLWKSGIVTGGQPAIPVDVDLRGVQTLILQVTDAGDGADSDHADWADARIDMNSGAAPTIALAPYEQIALRTAHVVLNFQIGNDGRLYQQT